MGDNYTFPARRLFLQAGGGRHLDAHPVTGGTVLMVGTVALGI